MILRPKEGPGPRGGQPQGYHSKNSQLWRTHGLNLEERDRLYKEQHGACAACHSDISFAQQREPAIMSARVDSDPQNQIVYGILCSACKPRVKGIHQFANHPDLVVPYHIKVYLQKVTKEPAIDRFRDAKREGGVNEIVPLGPPQVDYDLDALTD